MSNKIISKGYDLEKEQYENVLMSIEDRIINNNTLSIELKI